MSRARVSLALVAATLLTSLSASQAASADEPTKADLARARSAFQEGVALAAANNCAAALVKYKEVAQVKSTPQVAFNMAECEARLGRLVAALGNYRVAASQAADDKRAVQVLREAPARVEDLEARIPKLTVTRGKGADTAAIFLDDTEIGQSQLGNPIPVDPGPHTIVAKSGGKEYLHETVKLDEKQTRTFEVKLSIAAPVVEAPAVEKPVEEKPVDHTRRNVGIGLTIAGGVVTVVGLAMLAPRASAMSKLSQDCHLESDGKMHCPTTDSASGVNTFTGLTVGLASVGLVAVAAGIVLIVKSPSSNAEKSDAKDTGLHSIRIVPSVAGATGPWSGGLTAVGRF